jgi:hypothetical protein
LPPTARNPRLVDHGLVAVAVAVIDDDYDHE